MMAVSVAYTVVGPGFEHSPVPSLSQPLSLCPSPNRQHSFGIELELLPFLAQALKQYSKVEVPP